MVKKRTLAILGLIALGVVGASFAFGFRNGHNGRPRISASRSAVVGGTLSVMGSGFGRNGEAQLQLGGQTSNVKVDSNGQFAIQLTVNETAGLGTLELVAIDTFSGLVSNSVTVGVTGVSVFV